MRQEVIRQALAGAEFPNNSAKINRVPKEGGCDRQVEPRGAVALVPKGAVPEFAMTLRASGLGHTKENALTEGSADLRLRASVALSEGTHDLNQGACGTVRSPHLFGLWQHAQCIHPGTQK